MLQKDEASSREKRTPPMGAPNAAEKPHAAPSDRKSRRSPSLWKKGGGGGSSSPSPSTKPPPRVA